MKKAVVAGHVCVDIFPKFDHSINMVPGHLYEIGKSTFAIGGAVSNTGMTMQRLGVDVNLMGTVGADAYGEKILDIMKSIAPNQKALPRVDASVDTSYTLVFDIPGQDRYFFHCPGANATFGTKDIDWKAVADADLFHFGYPCFMASAYANDAAMMKEMYRKAKELNVTTSLDPGMPDPHGPAGKVPWKKVLADVLPTIDVFMPSADELLYMVSPDKFGEGDNLTAEELTELGDLLLGMGSAVVAIKLGGRGMYIRSAGAKRLAAMGKGAPADIDAWADREYWFPVFKPTVFKGATGAGDASIGGFLTSLLYGLPLVQAGRMAAAVGACNVEAPDSLSGVRTWDDTLARVNANWETTPFTVTASGWKQLENNVWQKA